MRRVTIFDDQSGLEIMLTFDAAPDSDGTVITSLALSTPDGSGVRSEHLRQLEEFGLHMPRTKTTRASASAVRAALSTSEGVTKSTVGDGEAAPGQVASPSPSTQTRKNGTQPYRRRPPDADLKAAYKLCDGKRGLMATHFGVPPETIGGWLALARRDGVLPPLPPRRRPKSTADAQPLIAAPSE